jgi:hypothetical protein
MKFRLFTLFTSLSLALVAFGSAQAIPFPECW